jgi:hypothetical protein
MIKHKLYKNLKIVLIVSMNKMNYTSNMYYIDKKIARTLTKDVNF